MKEYPYIIIYKNLNFEYKTVSHIVYAYNLREARYYGEKLLNNRNNWKIERVLEYNN